MNQLTHSNLIKEYGPIVGIVLLGGGKILRQICLWAISQGVPVKVVTAARHANESHDGEILSDFLSRMRISNLSVDDIADEKVKGFLGDTTSHFCLSLGAAWIFKEQVISDLFHNRLLNLHGTRLPQNRGGGGTSWQIMMGNKFGFCVLHRVDGGVDTGELVAVDEFLYPASARKPIDYDNTFLEKNLDFVINFIEDHRFESKPVNSIQQSEYFSTYWPRLNTDINGWIDWSSDASEIERLICAFDDNYSGAQTYLNGKRVRLKSVCLSPQDGSFHSYQSGIIYRKGKKWLCVAVKGSTLVVEGIYDENGKDIFSTITIGDRFVTPRSVLDSATERPIYTPKGMKRRVFNITME
ncbi:MAG: hypothetical protein HQL07_10060 [Nitrospirae bacterium]|nr:hypothetical protein [Magnetococcales bacterium]HAT49046.1 hypothetical protein [Alphaproteobacteria bacterium]